MSAGKIFEAASKALRYVILQEKIHEKRVQLGGVKSKTCGNCFHWMKSSCVPRKKYKLIKSCNSPACDDFTFNLFKESLAKRFSNEIDELKRKTLAEVNDEDKANY